MSVYSINPDRNQPWNQLPDLPIAPELYQGLEVYEALGNAKLAMGRLQGRSIAIPHQDLLLNAISLQEAKASSEIENIFTTDDDLYKASSEASSAVNPQSKEVLHYREAIWRGIQYLKTKGAFDLDYFIEMYRIVKQASDGIRPPFVHLTIKRGSTGPQAGQVVYTPPKGKGLVEKKLENLADFLNDQEARLDPLLKMAMAHYQFEVIHPFRDGNGRTGRLLNIHFLTHAGLLDYPVLYLSKYIINNKSDYYAYLAGVSQRGDWKNWLIYMLKAIETTANLTYQKINEILTAMESILEAIEQETDIRRPEQLVDGIFRQPYAKVKHFTDASIYAENTARDYLNKLTEMGVMEKRTISGHHYYVNLELFRVLAEG
jgi:Fic family protein